MGCVGSKNEGVQDKEVKNRGGDNQTVKITLDGGKYFYFEILFSFLRFANYIVDVSGRKIEDVYHILGEIGR